MNKYKSKRTEIDGIIFDSKREALRYLELSSLERAGLIFGLVLQPKYLLGTDEKPVLIKSKGYPNGRRAFYKADFRYWENDASVIEDVKGYDTPMSRLKRAVVEAQYGIEIILT